MARLIDWPADHKISSMEPLTGPRGVKATVSTAISGFTQTSSSPNGLWRWQFSFPPMRDRAFRVHRGMIAALHGGVNAVRIPFYDPDAMSSRSLGQMGVRSYPVTLPWSNGRPWSNTAGWKEGNETVPLAAATPIRGDTIVLSEGAWGYKLEVGDRLGFMPFHFGLYIVTQVYAPGAYRIWPPLRRAVTAANFATMRPVMAMKLEGEGGANAARGTLVADSLTATFVEVEDSDVRTFYTD